MPTAARIVLVVITGYALGSIPVAAVVARRRAAIDLREVGDRNPGYWNAKTQLGRRAAAPVFVGDIAKGAAAAAIGVLLAAEGQWWLAYVGGGAAMVGHAWPVTQSFRGGRSVLAFVGAGLVAAPVPAMIAVALSLASWLVTRRFDLGARVGVAAFPVVQLVIDGPVRTAATGALMTLIGIRFAQAAWASRTRDTRPDRRHP